MRPPLFEMVIRTPELDRSRYPHLHHLNYPFGGTMGRGVRTAGHRNHAGWDLYAEPNSPAFAISDGRIVQTGMMHGYGNIVLLEFEYQYRTLYALYAHLTSAAFHPVDGEPFEVTEGTRVALTGTTGNAIGEPPHLHFEIWTKRNVGHFPDGRISPGEVLGYVYDNMDNRMPYRNAG
jgi:murein DD-endopeptidase MepM/ murein hydrolase activator NlpD